MSVADGGGEEPAGWREALEAAPPERALRIKRLRIRCWRRGTKEMDLILGEFIDRFGPSLDEADLDAFEALIREEDQTLYAWVAGAAAPPPAHAPMIERLAAARPNLPK